MAAERWWSALQASRRALHTGHRHGPRASVLVALLQARHLFHSTHLLSDPSGALWAARPRRGRRHVRGPRRIRPQLTSLRDLFWAPGATVESSAAPAPQPKAAKGWFCFIPAFAGANCSHHGKLPSLVNQVSAHELGHVGCISVATSCCVAFQMVSTCPRSCFRSRATHEWRLFRSCDRRPSVLPTHRIFGMTRLKP